MTMSKVDPRKVDPVVARIRLLLAGLGPEIQGAVLADLLAIFLAGHHPALREEVLAMTIDCARKLVAPNEAEIFSDGKPEGWERQ
jgi:hypothetical protein